MTDRHDGLSHHLARAGAEVSRTLAAAHPSAGDAHRRLALLHLDEARRLLSARDLPQVSGTPN